ncbi:MAG: type II toxin-antitoxin system HipA family toxin [Nocardioides sp.]|uniref:type II toxin-antitoxin system HipA family toxin n=1 Tax=Nocardioides sp. TaxID=35761 RepID=UPI0039E63E0C
MVAVTPAPTGQPDQAYVWVWLPGQTEPVVAGLLRADGDVWVFGYESSYLERHDAIALPELPVQAGWQRPAGGKRVAGVLRDVGPDGWGRRLIHARRLGRDLDGDYLGLLSYLLEPGSDRIGGLDFQASVEQYVPRVAERTSLAEMQQAVDELLAGQPPTATLGAVVLRGAAVGGARPKVLLRDTAPNGSRRGWVAKLGTHADTYPVVRAEAVAMDLAARVGLDVPEVLLDEAAGREVLLVERFDRVPTAESGPQTPVARRVMVSAETIVGLGESTSPEATYPDFADQIRARFTDPDQTLRELFARIVFNICISNTDDHPRNHAAFWDGHAFTLTPAYDLCPQSRFGSTAQQAMAIDRDGRREGRLSVCLDAAPTYHLDRADAAEIIEQQVTVIREQWPAAADAAHLTAAERRAMWEHQILNPTIR